MLRPTRIKITDLNPHLMCVLCGGYYMDATTVIECLHSFCKSCIVRYLETSKYCPICDVQIHKTKPLLSIRSDQTLQEIVYKLVPGLFQNEMKRRREFYAQHPEEAAKISTSGYCEERGEVDGGQRFVGNPDESINFSLEYSDGSNCCSRNGGTSSDKPAKENDRRYLHCPTAVTVAHLKKLVRAKYGLTMEHKVEILCSGDCLDDDFSLMDISYIYSWKRVGPLRLFYRIYEKPKKLKRPLATSTQSSSESTSTSNPISTTTQPPPTTNTSTPTTSSATTTNIMETTITTTATTKTDNKKETAKSNNPETNSKPKEQIKPIIEMNKRETNNNNMDRKRSICMGEKRRKTKPSKRIRKEETIVRGPKALFALPPPLSSPPRENGTKEQEQQLQQQQPSRLNGEAGGVKETSADKENKMAEDKELMEPIMPEKMNGLVTDGEKKKESSPVLGKT